MVGALTTLIVNFYKNVTIYNCSENEHFFETRQKSLFVARDICVLHRINCIFDSCYKSAQCIIYESTVNG